MEHNNYEVHRYVIFHSFLASLLSDPYILLSTVLKYAHSRAPDK